LQDLQDILESLTGGEETPDDGADAEPKDQAEKEPFSKMGDLWHLGEHRLLCGSATSEQDMTG
jgi:hypothetical protein